jgi:hypothetical protein
MELRSRSLNCLSPRGGGDMEEREEAVGNIENFHSRADLHADGDLLVNRDVPVEGQVPVLLSPDLAEMMAEMRRMKMDAKARDEEMKMELKKRDEELKKRDEEMKKKDEELGRLKVLLEKPDPSPTAGEEFLCRYEEERQADLRSGIGYQPVMNLSSGLNRPDRNLNPSYTSNRTAGRSNLSRDEPRPRFPFFSGKTSWESFMVQFELFSKKYDWSLAERHDQLIFCMRDDALEFVAQQPLDVQSHPTLLSRALERRFGDHILPETHRARLHTMKKQPRESIDEFAFKVSSTVAKAYPGLCGGDLYTSLVIEHIVNGLGDSSLAYDILSKRPHTIEQAIDMIQWHECCKAKTTKVTIRQLSEETE